MDRSLILHVFSDVHYAGPAERERGGTEFEVIRSRWLRGLVRTFRHWVWKRDPFSHNHLLDDFIARAGEASLVIGNGDYSCDTAFVGVSDPAAFESARHCLDQLRSHFGPKLQLILGDHELGKMSLFGGRGGLRLASFHRARNELKLEPFWSLEVGQYVLMGVTSTLLAYPVYELETMAAERAEWLQLRTDHFEAIRHAFRALRPQQRVLLFCHDPTALPFLWDEVLVRSKARQIEMTLIGHLHSELFLWQSRLLSGMPVITVLGNSIRRMSTALNQARLWKHFRIKLCPALAGIELLKDGGFCRIALDPSAKIPMRFERCRLPARIGPTGFARPG